jgi:hypothetical protein
MDFPEEKWAWDGWFHIGYFFRRKYWLLAPIGTLSDMIMSGVQKRNRGSPRFR